MKIYVTYDEINAGEIFYEDENGKYVIRSKTRADLIRSMSDEELAKVVDWDVMTEMGWRDEPLIEWLEQEVE